MIDKKLVQKSGALSDALRINMKKIDVNNLTWEDPIVNQIISSFLQTLAYVTGFEVQHVK